MLVFSLAGAPLSVSHDATRTVNLLTAVHLVSKGYPCSCIRAIFVVGPTETLSRVFLLFFLFSDWLMLTHLKSRIECGFLDIFSRHICCTEKKQYE